MAKESSVFYKLPIEEMRGKLATKQDGIMYAGQEQGNNTLSIGDGNHAATNFEKYIVLTKSRGKNRFYVKSRTTVANSTGTINTRAILALAMPFVDAIYARRDDAVEMVAFKEAYQFYQKGETLREYLTRVVVESIRRGKTNIEYLSKPNQQGLSEYVSLIANPYKAFSTAAPMIFTNGDTYGDDARDAKIIQEYLKYRAVQMGANLYSIKVHDTITGTTYKMTLLANPDSTMQSLDRTLQARAYRVVAAKEGTIESATLFPFELDYAISGQPWLDAEKTTPLVMSTVISTITDLYL